MIPPPIFPDCTLFQPLESNASKKLPGTEMGVADRATDLDTYLYTDYLVDHL